MTKVFHLSELDEEDFKNSTSSQITAVPIVFTVDRKNGIIQVWPLPEDDFEFIIMGVKK